MNSELVDAAGNVSLLCVYDVTQLHDVVNMLCAGSVQRYNTSTTDRHRRHGRRSCDVADCEQTSEVCATDDEKCVW